MRVRDLHCLFEQRLDDGDWDRFSRSAGRRSPIKVHQQFDAPSNAPPNGCVAGLRAVRSPPLGRALGDLVRMSIVGRDVQGFPRRPRSSCGVP